MKHQIKDIHTHRPDAPHDAIVSIRIGIGTPATTRPCSIGLHPWDVSPRMDDDISKIESEMGNRNILAIGEAGIDRLCNVPVDEQARAFRLQAAIAEQWHLPLIIHNVRATAEIMALKRELRPTTTWIIHGFRGKPQLAEQLLEHGFMLSFGEKFNQDTVKAVPATMMFTETDESRLTIDEIRRRIALAKEMDPAEFDSLIDRNTEATFTA